MSKRRMFFWWVVTAIILGFFIFPLLWVYVSGFKNVADLYNPGKILFNPTLENFRYIFVARQTLMELRNSVVISVASTALVMVVSLPAAYSFARFNTGSGHLLFVTISTRMFPAVVAALPFFFLFKGVGLLDTHFGLIIMYVYINMSFATFLLFGFFREIPEELEQAAMVDGYGRFEILRKITFPLIMPGAAITAVFCLVWSWNEFLFANLFTRMTARTVAVGLSRYSAFQTPLWGPMAAAMAIAILPTLIVAWFMQRYIIRGLTFGAVKG